MSAWIPHSLPNNLSEYLKKLRALELQENQKQFTWATDEDGRFGCYSVGNSVAQLPEELRTKRKSSLNLWKNANDKANASKYNKLNVIMVDVQMSACSRFTKTFNYNLFYT